MSWNRGTIKPHLVQRPCKHCGAMMSVEELSERNQLRKDKIMASLEQRVKEGLPIGRPRLRNDDEISRLLATGLSIRAVARKLGFSPSTIQESIKSRRVMALNLTENQASGRGE